MYERIRGLLPVAGYVALVWLTGWAALHFGGVLPPYIGFRNTEFDFASAWMWAVPVAVLQAAAVTRPIHCTAAAVGWPLAGACLLWSRQLGHMGSWRDNAAFWGTQSHVAPFVLWTIPAVAAAIILALSLGLFPRLREPAEARLTVLKVCLVGTAVLVFLFVDFRPKVSDCGGRMQYYEPVLLAVTLTALVLGTAQGYWLRQVRSAAGLVLGWVLAALIFVLVLARFGLERPLPEAFAGRDQYYMSLFWRSYVYLLAVLPIVGSIGVLRGRWAGYDRKWQHLIPVALLFALLLMVFIYREPLFNLIPSDWRVRLAGGPIY